MNKTVGIVILVAVLVCAGVGGGAWWWLQQQTPAAFSSTAPVVDASQPRYVSLEKVVVMLRATAPKHGNDYLALDLVLRTDAMHEKTVKAELPMLKGVAVRTLSKLDVEQARAMSIEEWTDLLSADLVAAYADRPMSRHFDQVMVSRLIIE